MHRILPRCRITASVVVGLVLTGVSAPGTAAAQGTASNPFAVQPAKPSLFDSLSSSAKRGWDGLTRAFVSETPVHTAADPTSLRSRGRPSPRLHVEVARLNEHAGRLDEAEQHYQTALQLDRDDLGAMLNYARLMDRRGRQAEAFELYRRAVQTHPREASVYNYLGLHYDRRRMPNEAAATLSQAVQLKPDEPLYRNNLAHVLVELGQLQAAYEQLHAVHGEAVAYYNLGYLLHRRGQREAAVQHLSAALRRAPNLAPARQLLAELQPPSVAGHRPPAAGNPAAMVPRRPAEVPHPSLGPSSAARPAGPPHGYPPTQPPAPAGSFPGPQRREAFPQGPSHVAPPARSDGAWPRQSSTGLQQPDGIDLDQARRNAPHIRLTGATSAITRVQAE